MTGSSQDIPDGVVYTEVKKTLVNGTTGILRCRFKGLPNGVFWKKGSDPAKSPSIIIWSYGEKSGSRYEDGSCDIDGRLLSGHQKCEEYRRRTLHMQSLQLQRNPDIQLHRCHDYE